MHGCVVDIAGSTVVMPRTFKAHRKAESRYFVQSQTLQRKGTQYIMIPGADTILTRVTDLSSSLCQLSHSRNLSAQPWMHQIAQPRLAMRMLLLHT